MAEAPAGARVSPEMATLPLVPQIKRYRGAKPEKHRKVAEGHAVAQHICDHVNALIANNPAEIQQYTFGYIAADLRLTKEEVRDAISDGGSNGIIQTVCPDGPDGLPDINKFTPPTMQFVVD